MNAWTDFFEPRTEDGSGGCVLWAKYTDALGYGRCVTVEGEVKAHRISWVLAFGPIPDGLCVLHICDVRRCVNPGHLWLGTQQDNIADMVAKGRNRAPEPRYGSANPMAALDEDHVWSIREMLRLKLYSQAAIARSFGVSPMTISRIATGQSWPHVRPGEEICKPS